MIDDTALNSSYNNLERSPNSVLVPATIAAIVAILADCMILYMISKNKALQTHKGYYILNWSICDVIFLILQPNIYVSLANLNQKNATENKYWAGEVTVVSTINALFVIALALDWYFLNYAPPVCQKVRKYFKAQVGLIWFLMVILSVYICMDNVVSKVRLWNFIVFTGSLAIYVIIHILNLIKEKSSDATDKSNLSLFLVSSFFLFWFPNYVVNAVRLFDPDRNVSDEVEIVTQLIGYLNAIFINMLLYRCEKNFRDGFRAFCISEDKEGDDVEKNCEIVDINK